MPGRYQDGKLRMHDRLSVGFGCVTVWCDGVKVWYGDSQRLDVGMIERMAESHDFGNCPSWMDDFNGRDRSCEHLWEIEYEAPLWNASYVRKGVKLWVMYKHGMGFA